MDYVVLLILKNGNMHVVVMLLLVPVVHKVHVVMDSNVLHQNIVVNVKLEDQVEDAIMVHVLLDLLVNQMDIVVHHALEM